MLLRFQNVQFLAKPAHLTDYTDIIPHTLYIEIKHPLYKANITNYNPISISWSPLNLPLLFVSHFSSSSPPLPLYLLPILSASFALSHVNSPLPQPYSNSLFLLKPSKIMASTQPPKIAQSRLRACYNCRFLADAKTFEQGCPTCFSNRGCTANFSGMVTIIDPAKSWVKRYQGYPKAGMYALAVAKPPKKTKADETFETSHFGADDDDDFGSNADHRSSRKQQPKLQEHQDEIDKPVTFGDNIYDDDDEVTIQIGKSTL